MDMLPTLPRGLFMICKHMHTHTYVYTYTHACTHTYTHTLAHTHYHKEFIKGVIFPLGFMNTLFHLRPLKTGLWVEMGDPSSPFADWLISVFTVLHAVASPTCYRLSLLW